jgi:hypothetical protein
MLPHVRPLLERQLVYVTGKGGVGKTTVATAAALAAAARGRKTILVEVGGRQRLPDLFGVERPPLEQECQLDERLWTLSVDPPRALEEFVSSVLPTRGLVRVLTQSNAFRAFVEAAPGARELVTIGKIWDTVQERRWNRRRATYDTVVVDGPASGHGVGLLRTPRTFADIARVGPIHSQATRIREWLEDSRRTSYVAVATAADMPVQETLELEGTLRRTLGRDLGAIVVNGVLPRRFSGEELGEIDARLDGRSPVAVAARSAARSEAAQARNQQSHLQRLRRNARAPVTTLPFLFEPELELGDVRALAERLDLG